MVLVTVAICSNRIDGFFYKAIDSMLLQTFKDIEILVVLNGDAKDSGNEVLTKYNYANNIKVISTKISYLNHSLNIAIENANGKYVARMDADDISYPERIATQFYFMEKNPEIVICGSWYDLIDEKGLIIKNIKTAETDSKIRSRLFYKNPICHPTVMFKKEYITKLGGYINGVYAEDYDLWIRAAKNKSLKFANIQKSLLGYRFRANGEARKSKIAYSSVSAIQWREFISTSDLRWLIFSFFSMLKAFLKGR